MNSNWSVNRILALVLGIVFTLVGILGFFATATMAPSYVFGFGVDLIHNIIHLVIGLAGLAAAFTGWSRRYNQVFGYYIEVTKANLERVPPDYERKQTLAGVERFTTTALTALEHKILSAESGLKELESQLFTKVLRELATHSAAILATAAAVGEFDALRSLALVARRRGYVRPQMDSGLALVVRDGRHPVLETGMKTGEFVPNDLSVDTAERQLLLLTGPNMAGKSTYLRQVALIVIMAQMGSFVPATEARIGLTDRVLTRIGARDELRRGESTFMVEMRESARLLQRLTDRSLLLLDEVGRGTSTFDGLAIAWAVAEYLHDSTRAKVLFATHFHELTQLAGSLPRLRNFNVSAVEEAGKLVFLHRVQPGGSDHSYGVQVARLAGIPPIVAARAEGRAMAERLGFPRPDPTLIATAISEIARNIVVHVGQGEIVLKPIEEKERYGLAVIATDRGAGIRDLEAALRGDYSGRGGLGLGLPGARRLMDEFHVTSEADSGTVVTMKKWRFRDELARLREERRRRA